MKELKEIINRASYVDRIPSTDWNESHFNQYVVTGVQSGNNSITNRIGRLVQVRINDGVWKTDVVLLRHIDGSLSSHENQSFILLKGEDKNIIDKMFKDANVCKDDPYNREYSIEGRDCYKGFIVPDEEMRRVERNMKIDKLTKQ